MGEAQRAESIYDSADYSRDHEKIKKVFGEATFNNETITEKELKTFLRDNLYEGDPIKDSIRSLKIRELYFVNSIDDVNSMYMNFRLLMIYNGYLTESELEEENRKVAEGFFHFHNYTVAIEFFKESIKYKSDGGGNPHSCGRIGSCYLELGELDSMVVWFQRSTDYFLEAGELGVQHINSMGFIYSLIDDFEKAEYFYKKGFESFQKSKVPVDSVQYYILRSNWASLKLNTGDEQAALTILNSITSDYLEFDKYPWLVQEVYHKIAEVQMTLGNCQEVRRNFEIVQETFEGDKINRAYLKHLELKLNAFEFCNVDNELRQTYKEYLSVKKELDAYESKRADFLELIQRRVYNDQITLTANNLALKEDSAKVFEISNARLKRLMWISSLSFMMILAFGIIQYRSRKKRQLRNENLLNVKHELVEEKEQRQELQQKIDKQEIENKRLELSGMLSSIDRNSTLTAEIVKRLEGIKNKVENEGKDDLGALLQFIRSQNDLTNIEELLNRNVDVLGGNFKERLMAEYPNLTNSELQLIIYIKLGLPTKEIAQIKNVEPSSVRIFKHRVKAKLGIPKDLDLVKFIKTF